MCVWSGTTLHPSCKRGTHGHLRVGDQCDAEGQPALHAAGEVLRRLPEAVPVELHLRTRFGRPGMLRSECYVSLVKKKKVSLVKKPKTYYL